MTVFEWEVNRSFGEVFVVFGTGVFLAPISDLNGSTIKQMFPSMQLFYCDFLRHVVGTLNVITDDTDNVLPFKLYISNQKLYNDCIVSI